MDEDVVKPGGPGAEDEPPVPRRPAEDDTKVDLDPMPEDAAAGASGAGDAEPEPPRASKPPVEPAPPWESPGRPRNAVIGMLVVVALLGTAALVSWALLRPETTEAPTGALGDPAGTCGVRTVDEAPGGMGLPTPGEAVPERSTAVVTTNVGQVTVMLFGDLAPCGVASFTNLAEQRYYTSVGCPSMTSAMTEPTLVLRCGIPSAQGGPGYRVRGEHPFSGTAVVDALALVNDDRGLVGGEFALIRGQSVPTNAVTVIGQVIDGFAVLDSITARAGAQSYAGAPPVPVTVLSVQVLPRPGAGPSSGSSSGIPGVPGPTSPGLPGIPGLPGTTEDAD